MELVKNQVDHQLWRQVNDRIVAVQVSFGDRKKVSDQVWQQVWNRGSDQVWSHVSAQFHEELSETS